ncbi:preprotein translocase subunit SecG [candidate division WWE3 bacterium CG_4_9_14_3_um_filter_41_6]|uniref:Protein-export membrane protein SecG n=1 Tax=candidate division WWE3 bacterium CG_4_10_14_0_2_um_filter_41_14 TaxID=1975072 RepID=A0A2M7TI92_UNCKA|nr:MAG: preprotein translocase subunit SecG [candidate division WWE3 bacterium CG_4_10_14_0_2_um_filter_41_14]PJA37969.1 MAG: preprotein translocase subunit SecG [candidate division WWE3 bacterium CG_4_9_14_3_um_filter_41_6]
MDIVIPAIQIVAAILLITLVLLQTKGVGLSGAFGGGGEVFYTRRGAEKIIFWLTIFVSLVFVSGSLASIILL